MRVDLNIDLGERDDEPDALYRFATVVNIACGGHAGDRASMRRAIEKARTCHCRVAAHPSFPDREGFGRRPLVMDGHDLAESIRSQCDALREVAEASEVVVTLIKPHGALYHSSASSLDVARCMIGGALASFGDALKGVVGPACGTSNVAAVDPSAASGRRARTVTPMLGLFTAAKEHGLDYIGEAFADRVYGDNGRLLPRTDPNALILDPASAATQAVRLAQRSEVQTICVHGDTPHAEAIAQRVHEALASIPDERAGA